MTNYQWVNRLIGIWLGMFFFMSIFFLLAFKVPCSPRYNYIDDSTLIKILSELANIYFPYIGVSIAGFLSLRKRKIKKDTSIGGFAKAIWYLIIVFNVIIFILSFVFIADPLSSADFLLVIFSFYALKFSILIAGLSAYLYAML